MERLKAYLRRIYRLSLNHSKKEDLVWKDLKKLSAEMEWRCGIYEKEKYIETGFEIGNDKTARFLYLINNKDFICIVNILENFPVELTTDLFILAAHFNNLLNEGVVIIHTENQCVEYHLKNDILVHLLYSGEIYGVITYHYNASKEIYWAFQRLIEENEAPAIIIADLLKKMEAEEEQNSKQQEINADMD